MATPESKVKDGIKKWLRANGFIAAGDTDPGRSVDGYYYMPQNMGMGVNGIPDFVLSTRDRHGLARPFGIEAKAPGKEPTPIQLERHAEMRAAGWMIFIVDEVSQLAEVEAWMNSIKRPN